MNAMFPAARQSIASRFFSRSSTRDDEREHAADALHKPFHSLDAADLVAGTRTSPRSRKLRWPFRNPFFSTTIQTTPKRMPPRLTVRQASVDEGEGEGEDEGEGEGEGGDEHDAEQGGFSASETRARLPDVCEQGDRVAMPLADAKTVTTRFPLRKLRPKQLSSASSSVESVWRSTVSVHTRSSTSLTCNESVFGSV